MQKVRKQAKVVSVVTAVAVLTTIVASAIASQTSNVIPTDIPSQPTASGPSFALGIAKENFLLSVPAGSSGKVAANISCTGKGSVAVSLVGVSKDQSPQQIVCDQAGQTLSLATGANQTVNLKAVPDAAGLVLRTQGPFYVTPVVVPAGPQVPVKSKTAPVVVPSYSSIPLPVEVTTKK